MTTTRRNRIAYRKTKRLFKELIPTMIIMFIICMILGFLKIGVIVGEASVECKSESHQQMKEAGNAGSLDVPIEF